MGRYLSIYICCLTLFVATSCDTIKEDRSPCPCVISLNFSDTDSIPNTLYLWFLDAAGEVIDKDTLLKEEYQSPYSIKLKRDLIACHVWGNIETDSLYYGVVNLDATGESAEASVEVCKEYADIYIAFKDDSGAKSISSKVVCSTLGREVNGSYIEGESVVEGVREENGQGRLVLRHRIIRQQIMEQMQLVISGISMAGLKGETTFDLGSWLKELQYNMNAKNLEDIIIETDMSFSYFNITVEPWDIKEKYEVNI